MTLPSVMLAMSPHSTASDSSGIRSRLISVSRVDLVRDGSGSAAMAPLVRTQLIQDSIDRLRRRVISAVELEAASVIEPEGPSPVTVGLDAQRTPSSAPHADHHSHYPPCACHPGGEPS